MEDIKQNNENSYTLSLDANDRLIMIDEKGERHEIEVPEPSQFKLSSFFTFVVGFIDFCFSAASSDAGLIKEEYFIKLGLGRIKKHIKLLSNLEIQILRESYSSRLTSINETSILNELKTILGDAFKTLKTLDKIRISPRIKILKPKNANLISNKVFQHLPQISQDICRDKETEASINVGKKEKEEKIKVILKISNEEGYALSKPINQFDSNIIDAVYTLFHNGNIIFSAKDIYEILTGGNKRPKKSPTLLPQIENSLDRLATIRVKIDATEQSKQQHGYEIKKAVLESYVLPLEKVEVLFKGSQQIETAYKLIKIPAIFEYSQYMKQFITIPIELLKLDKATPELICLRIAVLKRVFCICYGNMKYDRLAIETLLKEAGIEIQYKTQKQRYLKAIKQTLELLKDKKFLEDFTTVTKKSEGQKGRPTLQSFQLVPIFKNKELNSPS